MTMTSITPLASSGNSYVRNIGSALLGFSIFSALAYILKLQRQAAVFGVIVVSTLMWSRAVNANMIDQSISISRPASLVLLKDIAPTIVQEIRYAGSHNFIGRPIAGYQAAQCILTNQAAHALAKVQEELSKSRLSLKVYDCYRPQMSVDDFMAWSQQSQHQEMKMEFYPRVHKKDFFKLGYVDEKSGHSRASTVDLTIIALPVLAQVAYQPSQPLLSCLSPASERFQDNSIDFGTGYDCMDTLSHHDSQQIGVIATYNRHMLRKLMDKHGFKSYQKEWWHYTLKNEPFPYTYFNFPITD